MRSEINYIYIYIYIEREREREVIKRRTEHTDILNYHNFFKANHLVL